MKRALKSLAEVEADLRFAYCQIDDGTFVLRPGLEDLADKYDEAESAGRTELAKKDKQIADDRALLAKLTKDREIREALIACNVPTKWHKALPPLVSQMAKDGIPLETTIREFLDSDEGEPYRPKVDTPGQLTAQLHRLRLV